MHKVRGVVARSLDARYTNFVGLHRLRFIPSRFFSSFFFPFEIKGDFSETNRLRNSLPFFLSPFTEMLRLLVELRKFRFSFNVSPSRFVNYCTNCGTNNFYSRFFFCNRVRVCFHNGDAKQQLSRRVFRKLIKKYFSIERNPFFVT